MSIVRDVARDYGPRPTIVRMAVLPALLAFICFGVAPERPAGSAAPSGAKQKPLANDKTFVDLTPAELADIVPELKHLQPGESQDELPEILDRAGATVAAFLDKFPNTTCTERVSSDVYGPAKFKQIGKFKFHNLHRYSDYRQFNVQAEEKPLNHE